MRKHQAIQEGWREKRTLWEKHQRDIGRTRGRLSEHLEKGWECCGRSEQLAKTKTIVAPARGCPEGWEVVGYVLGMLWRELCLTLMGKPQGWSILRKLLLNAGAWLACRQHHIKRSRVYMRVLVKSLIHQSCRKNTGQTVFIHAYIYAVSVSRHCVH